MNFIQKLLTQRIEQLEADSKKLELVRDWHESLMCGCGWDRDGLIHEIAKLEEILGTDQD